MQVAVSRTVFNIPASHVSRGASVLHIPKQFRLSSVETHSLDQLFIHSLSTEFILRKKVTPQVTLLSVLSTKKPPYQFIDFDIIKRNYHQEGIKGNQERCISQPPQSSLSSAPSLSLYYQSQLHQYPAQMQ